MKLVNRLTLLMILLSILQKSSAEWLQAQAQFHKFCQHRNLIKVNSPLGMMVMNALHQDQKILESDQQTICFFKMSYKVDRFFDKGKLQLTPNKVITQYGIWKTLPQDVCHFLDQSKTRDFIIEYRKEDPIDIQFKVNNTVYPGPELLTKDMDQNWQTVK